MIEVQLLADAIGNAAPAAPTAGGVCVVSEVISGVIAAGYVDPSSRVVKVTGLGGSPAPIRVMAWSQVFDDRIVSLGSALVGRRVFVLVADRQPFIVDVAVSAPIVTTVAGG